MIVVSERCIFNLEAFNMESRTTLAGLCISCSDSPLSTAVSVIGIFTFAYAVLLGWYIRTQRGAKAMMEGPQEMLQFSTNVRTSLREVKDVAEDLLRDEARPCSANSRKLVDVLGEAKWQLEELEDLASKIDAAPYSSALRRW